MSATRSQVVDVTYDDYRTGERVRERKIQDVPYEELDEIRNRELALFRGASSSEVGNRRELVQYSKNDNYDDDRRNTQDVDSPPPRDLDRNRRRSDYRDRRRDYSPSDSESSRERRRRRRKHRRARSEQDNRGGDRGEQDNRGGDDDESRLWYSLKSRKDGNWAERNFDSSYDGIIAGVTGAVLGGMTARIFAKDDNQKKLKIVGAAAAGAATLNLAENKFRLYTEEKKARDERKGKRRDPEWDLTQPAELGGEMVNAAVS